MSLDTSTPVLLLGGKENALSITRHLGSLGIKVRVSGPPSCWALYSRHCAEAFRVSKGETQEQHWRGLLLGNDGRLNGHILWPLSDDAIDFVNRHRSRLASRYRLGEAEPDLQRAFLDKLETLRLADRAGIAAPRHWRPADAVALAGLRHELSFPVAVKPIQSHRFTKVFGRKLFVVDSSFEELEAILRRCRERKLDVFLVEMIPGPDSLLSSYYTYRDQAGRCLFEFTKSVIRRWPVNRGNACFHKTGWLPETAAAGARFFESTGLMGLGNIEFKRDPRDGKLKIIEVNARFTAAQELLRRAGYPIDLVIYCHLTGQPLPALVASRRTLYFWYPLRDLLGFLELRRRGELSTWGWLRSIATTAHVFPLASLSDPLPMLGAGFAVARHALG